jgi:hypothetical protein
MSASPNVGAIAELSASRDGLVLAGSILGTTDPQQVFEGLAFFCAVRLGSGVEEAFLCELSVGAALGLRLQDGRRIMLKAHPPDRSYRFLDAVCRVQRYLFSQGFPCPEPITGPLLFGRGLATVEAFADNGEFADAHEPRIRHEMARALAWALALGSEVADVHALSQGRTWPKKGLWPQPHNALFDFEATAAGAEWIDAFARRSKRYEPRLCRQSRGRTRRLERKALPH